MKKRPLILLCNDDGIRAPGIYSLWKALKEADMADIIVIAPEHEKSGFGSAVTWGRPIVVRKLQWHDDSVAFAIDGTPADCIKMALRIVLDRSPDFIMSGINAGSNAGRNVLHSGTIGAVIEGILRGIPGVALSCENGEKPNFNVAELYVPAILQYIMDNPLLPGTFLNVNFPHAAQNKVKGFRLTRQGKGRWIENPSLHIDTKDGPSYWLGGKPEEAIEIEDSDMNWLKQGYMTAVPIHIHELTDFEEINNRKENFEKYFLNKTPIE